MSVGGDIGPEGNRVVGEHLMAGNYMLPPDKVERFFLRDEWLPHVTVETVADALLNFPLRCRYSIEWLATAVRRALAVTMKNRSQGPARQSNLDTKKELRRLASCAGKLWATLTELSHEADGAVFDLAYQHWDGEGGVEVAGVIIGYPPECRAFDDTVSKIGWLAPFLSDVAASIPSQRPRWTEREWREIRIERGECLLPIFKEAFGSSELVCFPDFYQRIVNLVFQEGDIPDFEAVMSDAKRRHSKCPATFAEGLIPNPY